MRDREKMDYLEGLYTILMMSTIKLKELGLEIWRIRRKEACKGAKGENNKAPSFGHKDLSKR